MQDLQQGKYLLYAVKLLEAHTFQLEAQAGAHLQKRKNLYTFEVFPWKRIVHREQGQFTFKLFQKFQVLRGVLELHFVQQERAKLIDLRKCIREYQTDRVRAQIELVQIRHVLDVLHIGYLVLRQVQFLQVNHRIHKF